MASFPSRSLNPPAHHGPKDQAIVIGTSIEEANRMEYFSNTANEIETFAPLPRFAWGLREVSECTGLSVAFLRAEVRAGRLLVRRFGRRVLVRDEDLKDYLSRDSKRESKST